MVFYILTDDNSDRNYVIKVAVTDPKDLEFTRVHLVIDSRDIFLRQYAILNSEYAVAVYSHNVRVWLWYGVIFTEGMYPT